MVPAFLAVALLAGSTPRPPRPKVTVTVSPAVPRVGEKVGAFAIARDPGHVLHCPEITLEWGDGASSYQASDCPDVFSMPEDEPDRYVIRPTYRHAYREPGEYAVSVTLKSGGRSYGGSAPVVVH